MFGRHDYGDISRGIGYEYANFIPALENLGHEVIFFESLDRSAYRDYVELNKALLNVVENKKPHVIFCVLMSYEIWLETLEIIRTSSNAALVHWATDDSWKYEQFSRFMSPVFDVYVTTYPAALAKAKRDGFDNFVLSQWAANSNNIRQPLAFDKCKYGVTFVGSMYGNRKKWIARLKKRGVKVECFGYGWPRGPVTAEAIPSIFRESVINLNFADSGLVIRDGKLVRSRQLKARVFEVPGSGGLLLTEYAEHLEDFYSLGKEIVVFEDLDDLVAKIEHLLHSPAERDAIADAGFQRTKRDHSYEARFRLLIEKALATRQHRARALKPIDGDRFERIARLHKDTIFLKLLKTILLLPCILIWGKTRGARAARRVLFEISWRFSGRKTYTVRGLPGRLFYNAS